MGTERLDTLLVLTEIQDTLLVLDDAYKQGIALLSELAIAFTYKHNQINHLGKYLVTKRNLDNLNDFRNIYSEEKECLTLRMESIDRAIEEICKTGDQIMHVISNLTEISNVKPLFDQRGDTSMTHTKRKREPCFNDIVDKSIKERIDKIKTQSDEMKEQIEIYKRKLSDVRRPLVPINVPGNQTHWIDTPTVGNVLILDDIKKVHEKYKEIKDLNMVHNNRIRNGILFKDMMSKRDEQKRREKEERNVCNIL